MDGLSFSSWIILILGFIICFGGAFYCLLIIWGKQPERILDTLGISSLMESSGDALVNAGIYRPFEYMERGPKEQAITLAVVLCLLVIGWGLGAFDSEAESIYSDIDYDLTLKQGSLDPINGRSDENSEETFNVTVEQQNIANITFTLAWEDEPHSTGYQNDPDEFSLKVNTTWGEYNETPMTPNGGNRQGEVSLTFSAPGEYPDIISAGDYMVTVEMGDAGDQQFLGVGGLTQNDDGNDWTLTIEYDYYEEGFIE